MSRKAIVATALAVGLGIVFAAFSAADRARSRDGRATRGGTARSGGIENLADTFDPRFRQYMATTELQYVGPQGALAMDPSIGGSLESKAANLISFARTQEPQQAQATLRRVLDLGLETVGTERARKLLAGTYKQLATHQADAPSRQAYLLSQAASFTTDGEIREQLVAEATSLGAEQQVIDIAWSQPNSGATTRDFGSDDSCDGAPGVAAPSITPMDIANPIGGFQDTNFLEIVIPTGLGLALEIETTSPSCSDDPSCTSAAFDTDLSLWQMCDGGFEDMLLERDPDGDSGLGWLSKIQTTCLIPDSYFLEVTGQFGAAPKNFNVEIRVIGTCEVPVPDAWENDNTNADASPIGHPSSIPDHATGWRGREKQDIQDHSIFPRNENDNMLIDLSSKELVLMVSQKQVSSMVEGLPDIPSGPDEDSQILLLYQNDPHGGVCNRVPLSIANYCKSSGDCTSGGTPAVPSLPTTTCIPLSQIVFPGEAQPRFGVENPLAFNDDANPAGGNLGSQLTLCLPRTQSSSGTLANEHNAFVLRSRGWRPPFSGSASTLVYDYQAKGQAKAPCSSYETEPNQSFEDANPTPNESVYVLNGTWEGSETFPLGDVDIFGPFDTESNSQHVIDVSPLIINPFGDSEISLWAGPTDTGEFVLVATDTCPVHPAHPECIPDFAKPQSRVDMILAPANDFLGNTIADAGYYIVVSGDLSQPVPNWRYNLRVLTPRVDAQDTESNDFDPQRVDYRGLTIITGFLPARTPIPERKCDFDRYVYTLNEPQYMTFITSGPSSSLDTLMRLDRVVPAAPPFDDNGTATRVYDLNVNTSPVTAFHGEFSLGYPVAFDEGGFGVYPTPDNFKGRIKVALDSTATGASPTDCCGPIENPADVAGVIALCDRGTCGFAVKAKNAQNAGAAAVLIANVATSSNPQTGPIMGGTDATVTIPCASTGAAAGTGIKASNNLTNDQEVRVWVDDRRILSCDDDANDTEANPAGSRIAGCLPAGDYVVTVRPWGAGGPYNYVLTMRGDPGCVPTDPPTFEPVVQDGTFCPPGDFELNCKFPQP